MGRLRSLGAPATQSVVQDGKEGGAPETKASHHGLDLDLRVVWPPDELAHWELREALRLHEDTVAEPRVGGVGRQLDAVDAANIFGKDRELRPIPLREALLQVYEPRSALRPDELDKDVAARMRVGQCAGVYDEVVLPVQWHERVHRVHHARPRVHGRQLVPLIGHDEGRR
eukprot:CAMPEP_0113825764 /NCGR_PEP_ID=MMETSP0328-20130328/3916_1 /TAXON_ID=39455 /ORGANISM="Alexandrium minutum" /LENGTH=170 /DNA_ID=CAMNT_0000793725 /DNA_START=16 /DNA_END=525 /DNA_ORIENTATION=- /assembly_acc=CAM_ASM_000350